MKQLTTILVLVILSITLHAQKKYRIAVIGSSTSSGYGLFYADGIHQDTYTAGNDSDSYPVTSWVNRLKTYYKNLNMLDSMYEFAIWGEDVIQGYPTGSTIPVWAVNGPAPDINNNITRALSVNPDIIIVSFTSNNYNNDNYTIARVMAAFRLINNAGIANGHTKVYITTTHPREQYGSSIGLTKMKPLRDSIIKEFPGRYINLWDGVVAANGWDVQTKYQNDSLPDGYDGVHYNAKGHEIFFDSAIAAHMLPITTLPITLNYFRNAINGNTLTFQWETSSETNVNKFVLENQIQGDTSWHTITTIKSKAMNGNSSTALDYSFDTVQYILTVPASLFLLLCIPKRRKKLAFILCIAAVFILSCHKTLVTKTIYVHASYRLRIIDLDGNQTFSRTLFI